MSALIQPPNMHRNATALRLKSTGHNPRFEIGAAETHEYRTNAHPSETIHLVKSIAAATAAALDSNWGMRSKIDRN